MKLLLPVFSLFLSVSSQVAAQAPPSNKNQAPIMKLEGVGSNATGNRKAVIDAALDRVLKVKNPPVCPVFTDSELEALIVDRNEATALRVKYGQKSAEGSTLGYYTNMKVMKACEKQARRILFFWDDHSFDAAKKRFVQ